MNNTRVPQEKFFRELYEQHGYSPMALSSESLAHKALRFSKIAGIFEQDENFSVHDVGMGFADFADYIKNKFPNKKIEYSGSEILQEFVDASSYKFSDCKFYCRDIAEKAPSETYDYVVMSGIFHQRRDSSIRDWEKFAEKILFNSFKICKKGIAFNFISPFVDFYQPQVYYSNLPKWINYVNDNLSRFFIINHDYALFEYTVYVYKEAYMSSKYSQKEFKKYFHNR